MRTSSSRSRSAFTLIELLVVIAIIAILIGLLLPAVQKVREAAARSKCSNNLKQMALACHSYADVVGGLPPALVTIGGGGWANQSETASYGPSWVVLILPYIEQGPLYNQQSTSINNYVSGINDQGWRNIGSVSIPSVLCPSDPANSQLCNVAGRSWARGNYAANQGPGGTAHNGDATNVGLPNGTVSGRGPMWITSRAPFNKCMTIIGITDGSSNTIMIGEIRSGLVNSDPRGVWALGHAGSGSIVAYAQGDDQTINCRNDNSDDVEGASNMPTQGMGNWTGCSSGQAILRSNHTGGAQAAMGDGSVRFLRDSTSVQLLGQLGSASDGLPLPNDN